MENKEDLAVNTTAQPQLDKAHFNGVLEAQLALNKGGLIEKKDIVIITGANFDTNMIDDILAKIPETARFSGSQQSNSLPADISKPFNIEVADNVVIAYKLAENITIADRTNESLRATPIKSINASLKIPVKATIEEVTYSANVIVNRENVNEVKELLRNKTAMATTSHWGQIGTDGNTDKVLKKTNGDFVARLVLVPINTEEITQIPAVTERVLTNED